MSRRFGRNQRRKLREQLAAAETESGWHQSRASHFMDELYAENMRFAALQAQYNALMAQFLRGAHLTMTPAPICLPVKCSKCGAVTQLPGVADG